MARNHPNAPDPPPHNKDENTILSTEESTRLISTAAQNSVLSNVDIAVSATDEAVNTVPSLNEDETLASISENSSKKHAALLLLTLKEKHRLTQVSVDFAVHQIESMVEYTVSDIKALVEEKIREHCKAFGVDVPDLNECFDNTNPFSGLESEYLQTKFYKENFDLIVSVNP